MKRILILTVLILSLLSGMATSSEEGMYPISEIHKLNLKAKGLEIDPLDLFNPDGISLIDGICKVGGASGSFVSPDGLILTNHHVAYGGIRSASTPENDYLKEGFLARTRADEVEAKGYIVRITESYEDVSDEVLSAIEDDMDPVARSKAVEQRIKEIVARAEEKNPGMRAEVSEMFIGKTYVLFLYTYLRDIRLVYAPPRSIGNFGGEVDNWMWPRHTGDFSFLRAYVSPDGSPADYAPENVPYHPKNHLRVNPKGVDVEDFVFILGYPGRTYRHRTSHYVAYEEEVRMPFVADYYGWQIDVMEAMGEGDRAIALKLASRIKGLANTMKNYRGKLIGLKRLNLVEKKRAEEKKLQAFIEADPDRKATYGNLLDNIDAMYREIRNASETELVLSYLRRSSTLLGMAYTLYEASIERPKKDLDREYAYMDRNWERTKRYLLMSLDTYHEPADRKIFKHMLWTAASLGEDKQIPAVKKIIGSDDAEEAIDAFLDKAFSTTMLTDKAAVEEALGKKTRALMQMNDPFIQMAADLYPSYQELRETGRARSGELSRLYAHLVDVKMAWLAKDFVPDANGTLRLTFGHIRGYEPRDAVFYHPITTVDGVLQKTTGEPPFDTPKKLQDLIQKGDFGAFAHPDLGSVPTGILYNMDTTGGNSGSAVLNARGELVGVNFDRAYEATINDYAWNESYSRSIAVDIRYVLWVTEKFAGAGYLLEEMGVK